MADSPNPAEGITCPAPLNDTERVQLGHGSGGKQTAALVRDRFLAQFSNEILARQTDAAVVGLGGEQIAVSTDTFVVKPLEFPGGDIGSLSVHGTLNDVAMMGARPLYLTAGFVLEEGLSLELLDRVIASMARAANAASVPIICGDTKVVERGKADGLYINTTGIGQMHPDFAPSPEKAKFGDVVIVSGPIGRHGIAVMAQREGLEFDVDIESDAATLWPLVERLRDTVGDAVIVLRDPTRGGIASTLNEIAQVAGVGIVLEEDSLPIPEPVIAACELLGFDPLYVANEGILLAIVDESAAADTVAALQTHPLGVEAAVIGSVVETNPGIVALQTSVGGTRVVDMLPGDQLPRIC
ncbi:hydrogenase expression/formation protein HypE [Gemmatimonadota bacterium]